MVPPTSGRCGAPAAVLFHVPSAAPLHRALGLADDAWDGFERFSIATRRLKLALFSVMWSRALLLQVLAPPPGAACRPRRPKVLVGPGENAGVARRGRRDRRSDPHREPQPPFGDRAPPGGRHRGRAGSSATCSPWARGPSGSWTHSSSGRSTEPRERWLFEGVVAGISGYGNAVGVPTVGGELTFDATLAENPLVNVLCMGALPTSRLVLGRASGAGNVAVLLGATTGRDGIGGVSVLASAGFGGRRPGRRRVEAARASRSATPTRRSA